MFPLQRYSETHGIHRKLPLYRNVFFFFFSDCLQYFIFVFSTLNVRYHVCIYVHACKCLCVFDVYFCLVFSELLDLRFGGWSLILSHSWLVFLQIILLFYFLSLFWNSNDTHIRPFDIISQFLVALFFSLPHSFFFFFSLSFRLGDFY